MLVTDLHHFLDLPEDTPAGPRADRARVSTFAQLAR
jgi:hypothetical protein